MKKAFSLIELMIVIMIIGVIYTLVITQLKNYDKEKIPFKLETLKPSLGNLAKDGVDVKFLCFDDCKECAVYIDGVKYKDFNNFFSDDVEIYRYDYNHGLVEKKLDIFFEDDIQRDVCFSFHVDKNMVSDQVVVVYDTKVFDYTNYFSDVDIYNSTQELIDEKEKLIEEVR